MARDGLDDPRVMGHSCRGVMVKQVFCKYCTVCTVCTSKMGPKTELCLSRQEVESQHQESQYQISTSAKLLLRRTFTGDPFPEFLSSGTFSAPSFFGAAGSARPLAPRIFCSLVVGRWRCFSPTTFADANIIDLPRTSALQLLVVRDTGASSTGSAVVAAVVLAIFLFFDFVAAVVCCCCCRCCRCCCS